MKFKTFRNEPYDKFSISVNGKDTIRSVVEKISKILTSKSDDIILIHKKTILNTDTCFNQYKIRPNDFVLVIHKNFDGHQSVQNECFSPEEFDCPQLDIQIDGLLKRGINNKKSFEVAKKRRKETLAVSMECINCKFDVFTIQLDPEKNFQNLCELVAQRIDIPAKQIKWFQDASKNNLILKNEDLERYIESKSAHGTIGIHYEIVTNVENLVKICVIGRGAFGTVYKCMEIGSNQMFALKKFRISQDDGESYEKIKREIKTLLSISDHPRIVKMVKRVKKEKSLSILMEYASEGSIGNRCKIVGGFNEKTISKYCGQILEALDYLHNKRVLHRDIKGDNILIFENDNVKLCDFGLAKVLTDVATGDLLNGVGSSTLGTINWTAPEIFNSSKYYIPSDIWSFGATIVEMLTGKPPYFHMNMYQIIYKIGGDRKIEFDEPSNMSAELRSFLELCLKPDPSDRPSAKDLLNHEFIKCDALR